MTLNTKRPKVLYICWISTHESQISLGFALRSLVFQIIEVFDFSIGYNGEFEIFEKKSFKIGNSKFKKSPTYFYEDHWEENSGQLSKLLPAICRRSSVFKFSLPLGPMLTKTNTRGLRTLALCLTPAVGMTNGNFLQTYYRYINNSWNIGLQNVSALDIDLSRSLR